MDILYIRPRKTIIKNPHGSPSGRAKGTGNLCTACSPLETEDQFLLEMGMKNELGGLPSSSFVLCAKPTVPFGMIDEGHLGEPAGVGENRNLGRVTWNNSEGKDLWGEPGF